MIRLWPIIGTSIRTLMVSEFLVIQSGSDITLNVPPSLPSANSTASEHSKKTSP